LLPLFPFGTDFSEIKQALILALQLLKTSSGSPLLIDIASRDISTAPADAGVFTKVATGTKADLPVEGVLPGFSGAVEWLNSAPLTPQALRGKAVLVDFWTFNCINCLHALPYVRAWAEKYRDYGLVVGGVDARTRVSRGVSAMFARPSLD